MNSPTLSGLKISHKLALLGGIILLGAAVVGFIYWQGKGELQAAAAENERVNHVNIRVHEIDVALLEGRRAEKDFQLRKQTKYLEAHDQAMADALGALKRMDAIIRDPGQRAIAEELRGVLVEYGESFKRFAALQVKVGLDAKSGLLGKLREAVHGAEAVLSARHELELTNSMLMMRRHEKDYLARGDEKYVKKMTEEHRRFDELLADSGVYAEDQAVIRAKMAAYHKAFGELVEGSNRSDEEMAALRRAAHAVEPLLIRVEKAVDAMLEENALVQAATWGEVGGRFAMVGVTIAVLVVAFLVLLARGVVRSLNDGVAAANALAAGDLTREIEVTGGDEIAELLAAMARMSDSLREVVRQVKEGADVVTSASSEISAGNSDLSQRTEEQASSLEETASSMEELTSTVKQNADNARHANQLVSGAREEASKGGEVAQQAVEAVAQINSASKKIADIIGVIDEIAFQTNLLALNAAVEAARAGEQGRGFAVVAAEVRKLAQRSADSAKQIKDLIQDSVVKVEEGSRLVNASGEALERIVGEVRKVADIVSEIAAASGEQSSGIEQVNKAVMQMDEVTQQNAALVEEAAAASKSLEQQAIELHQAMAFFKLAMDDAPARGRDRPAATARRPAPSARLAAPKPRPKPAAKAVARSSAGEEEWEEF